MGGHTKAIWTQFPSTGQLDADSCTPLCVDVDECLTTNGGCDSKRKCVNTAGSMKCGDCPSGWVNDGEKGCKGLCLVCEHPQSELEVFILDIQLSVNQRQDLKSCY